MIETIVNLWNSELFPAFWWIWGVGAVFLVLVLAHKIDGPWHFFALCFWPFCLIGLLISIPFFILKAIWLSIYDIIKARKAAAKKKKEDKSWLAS